MSTVELLIVCLTVLLIVCLYRAPVALAVARTRAHEPDLLAEVGQSAVLNTLDERSLRGVVMKSRPEYIELAEVTYSGNGAGTKMMGRARVPASNIAFVQDVTTESTSGDNDH